MSLMTQQSIVTTERSVAQPGSASGLGPEGRGFKSLHSDTNFNGEKMITASSVFLAVLLTAGVVYTSALTTSFLLRKTDKKIDEMCNRLDRIDPDCQICASEEKQS